MSQFCISQCDDGWNDFVQAMELLVEKCVSSGGPNMSPGDALRRIFECISSGIILPGEYMNTFVSFAFLASEYCGEKETFVSPWFSYIVNGLVWLL